MDTADPTIRIRHKVAYAPKYRVHLHNDHFTPFDFVQAVLVQFFDKTPLAAKRIATNIHKKGMGLVGIYTMEIAETKVTTVTVAARECGFPLKCTMEPDEKEIKKGELDL